MRVLLAPPIRPLTVSDYVALPEDAEIRYELQEGALVQVPSPGLHHQGGLGALCLGLRHVPPHLDVLPVVDFDLQLAPAGQPATVRVPDIAVVTRAGYERVQHDGGLLRASEVVLAVEIMSAATRRTDTVLKHREYADAGIPHYWIVDIDRRPTLTVCRRTGESGYVESRPVIGVFRTEVPFPVERVPVPRRHAGPFMIVENGQELPYLARPAHS